MEASLMKNDWDTEEFKELRANVEKALKSMMKKVIKDHKTLDLPLIIWEDGKIRRIKPWETQFKKASEYVLRKNDELYRRLK